MDLHHTVNITRQIFDLFLFRSQMLKIGKYIRQHTKMKERQGLYSAVKKAKA